MTTIDFNRIQYAISAADPRQWPADVGAEVAFAGRSNVGKSSAINAITRRRKIARVSKTPGRTQQIVFFDLDEDHRLVDLPGYGYAKVPENLRRHWAEFITAYLDNRECLKALVVPMDIRRPLTELDEILLRKCREIKLPVHILLTKSDKLTRGKGAVVLRKVQSELKTQPDVTVQLFSAFNKEGVEEARGVVAGWLVG